ncbi:MAG: FecR family protein [Planctomycetaceae bacterium]
MIDERDLHNLIQGYLESQLTEQELDVLQKELLEHPKVRQQFLAYLDLDAALMDLGQHHQSVSDISPLAATPLPVSTGSSSLKYSRWLAPLAALVLTIVALIWFNLPSRTPWATLIETGPGVTLIQGESSRPTQSGDALDTNERISVPRDSSAKVKVHGLGLVHLGPEAVLQRGNEDRLVELTSGFASIIAEKQNSDAPWRIRTPEADAAVIGTEFNIATSGDRTALRVAEGRVQFTSRRNGESLQVDGGNRAIAEKDSLSAAQPTRSGSVLLITSRDPLSSSWNKFNQIVIDRLLGMHVWRMALEVDVRHFEEVQPADLENRALVIVSCLTTMSENLPSNGSTSRSRTSLLSVAEPAAYPVLCMTTDDLETGFGFYQKRLPIVLLSTPSIVSRLAIPVRSMICLESSLVGELP